MYSIQSSASIFITNSHIITFLLSPTLETVMLGHHALQHALGNHMLVSLENYKLAVL